MVPQGFPDIFEVEPPKRFWGNSWANVAPVPSTDQTWKHDEARKRLFGIELAKLEHPFNAACVIFTDTSHALWASQNWISDPVTISARDAYKASSAGSNLLDKEGILAKLLKFEAEKDLSGRFYVVEAKDRLKALELYAKIQGWTDKVDINASTNNFTNNSMKIVFVKPDNQNDNKLIEASAEPEIQHSEAKPLLNVRLVK